MYIYIVFHDCLHTTDILSCIDEIYIYTCEHLGAKIPQTVWPHLGFLR